MHQQRLQSITEFDGVQWMRVRRRKEEDEEEEEKEKGEECG